MLGVHMTEAQFEKTGQRDVFQEAENVSSASSTNFLVVAVPIPDIALTVLNC